MKCKINANREAKRLDQLNPELVKELDGKPNKEHIQWILKTKPKNDIEKISIVFLTMNFIAQDDVIMAIKLFRILRANFEKIDKFIDMVKEMPAEEQIVLSLEKYCKEKGVTLDEVVAAAKAAIKEFKDNVLN